jgi:2-polyprenyl-3-methyl-5-hydroxy-6-metoxy-1,4-benzoquinol methylase
MRPCAVNDSHNKPIKSFVKNNTDIYICPDCKCIMADIDFNKSQYETEEYYTMSKKDLVDIENKWGLRWRHVLRTIRHFSGERIKLLDVGAGNGYFMKLARDEYGYDSKGVGISETEIKFARDITGVEVIHEDIKYHKANYEIVTCFNVIEHVVDPRDFLKSLSDRVLPGGLLVLSTPNTTCLRSRLRGLSKWERVDPPHHINLFPKKALRLLLKEYGYKELNYETLSTYITLVDQKNIFMRNLFFKTLRMLNLGADHFIIAEKI